MELKNIFIKAVQSAVLSLFLISHSWGSFLLSNDDIWDTHKSLSLAINHSYNNIPSTKVKFTNLSTASIQFIYSNGEDVEITNPEFLITKNNRLLVTSTLYTEDLYNEDKKNLEGILSWPLIKPSKSFPMGKLRSTNNTSASTALYKKIFANNTNQKCAEALDLSLKQYNGMLNNLYTDLYPLHYLMKYYDYTEFEDIKHAEPPLVWWIERHFQNLLSSFKDNYEVKNQNIICPIVNFYTRRQTCYKCEQLIQSSAFNLGYLPIISFSELYLSDTINVDDFKICEQKKEEKSLIPFTKLQAVKNVFDNDLISDLRRLQNPISTYNFLRSKYYGKIDPYKEIAEEELLNIDPKTLCSYIQKRDRLQEVERFPLQFYISSN